MQAESTDILGANDAILSWGSLTVDLLGQPLDPERDVSKIAILHFPRLSEEQVLDGIDHETLKQSDLNAYVEFFPEVGQTEVNLTDFSMQGVYVDPVEHLPADSGTYLLTFNSAEESTQTLTFFSPELNGGEKIDVDSETAFFDADVDLLSMTLPVVEPAQRYIVDWSELTRSGTGRPLSLASIDRFILAGFHAERSVLQNSFFGLSDLAISEYRSDVMGQTALDLSDLSDVNGVPFDGFDSDLTWLMFLRCSLCVNPAPLYVGSFDLASIQ